MTEDENDYIYYIIDANGKVIAETTNHDAAISDAKIVNSTSDFNSYATPLRAARSIWPISYIDLNEEDN